MRTACAESDSNGIVSAVRSQLAGRRKVQSLIAQLGGSRILTSLLTQLAGNPIVAAVPRQFKTSHQIL